MLKKNIEYEGFDGEKYKEDFYFNMTKSELARMQLSADGGFERAMNTLINSKDNKALVKAFEDIILDSYGEKSADGKAFMKTADLREKFRYTNAYDVLLMEIIDGGADAIADFIIAVVPADMGKAIQTQKQAPAATPEEARARSEARMQGHQPSTRREAREQVPVVNDSPAPAYTPLDSERAPQPYDQ